MIMTLPSYNAILFHTKEEHLAALYDACLLLVNTYNGSDLLDFYEYDGVTSYGFMKFARNVLNQIADGCKVYYEEETDREKLLKQTYPNYETFIAAVGYDDEEN